MERNTGKTILAGLIATAVMTMMMYAAPMMGMPKMDIAGMISGMMKMPWIIGMTIHLMLGVVVFPFIYVFLLADKLPGPGALKGMTWGLILFILAQTMVMPMAGMGFFSSASSQQMLMIMGSLMGHVVYGAILGAIIGRGSCNC
ncbi:MAG: hypothetical protein KGJ11_00315 [Candidatus Omnitrophica bacterium]|nr:hypothetical protein [Candidatus Omnitrophota bacterium]